MVLDEVERITQQRRDDGQVRITQQQHDEGQHTGIRATANLIFYLLVLLLLVYVFRHAG